MSVNRVSFSIRLSSLVLSELPLIAWERISFSSFSRLQASMDASNFSSKATMVRACWWDCSYSKWMGGWYKRLCNELHLLYNRSSPAWVVPSLILWWPQPWCVPHSWPLLGRLVLPLALPEVVVLLVRSVHEWVDIHLFCFERIILITLNQQQLKWMGVVH